MYVPTKPFKTYIILSVELCVVTSLQIIEERSKLLFQHHIKSNHITSLSAKYC